MASLKDLRQRRKTVTSIWRMTSAMKMVSQSKFHKAHAVLEQSRRVHDALNRWAGQLLAMSQESELKFPSLMRPHNHQNPQAPHVVVMLGAESGMCGGFLQKLFRTFQDHVQQLCLFPGTAGSFDGNDPKNAGLKEFAEQSPIQLISVGRKGATLLQSWIKDLTRQNLSKEQAPDQKGYWIRTVAPSSFDRDAQDQMDDQNDLEPALLLRYGAKFIQSTFPSIPQNPQAIQGLFARLRQKFLLGQCVTCTVVHSHFHNILRQEPCISSLFPVPVPPHTLQDGSVSLTPHGLLDCDPNVSITLDACLDILAESHLLRMMHDHMTSEYGARMAAMDSAKDNAKDMLARLKLEYNHLRQSLITKELIEIISGAEAIA